MVGRYRAGMHRYVLEVGRGFSIRGIFAFF